MSGHFFHDLFDDMDARFDRMNRRFDELMRHTESGDGANGSVSYSKSTARTYNANGRVGEEVIVEQTGPNGRETRTVTRRIGDRSLQQVDTIDLKTGEKTVRINRRGMNPSEDTSFEEEWKAVEPTLQRLHHVAPMSLGQAAQPAQIEQHK
jgi:hypothetical protein